jgi:hypothetical protein
MYDNNSNNTNVNDSRNKNNNENKNCNIIIIIIINCNTSRCSVLEKSDSQKDIDGLLRCSLLTLESEEHLKTELCAGNRTRCFPKLSSGSDQPLHSGGVLWNASDITVGCGLLSGDALL